MYYCTTTSAMVTANPTTITVTATATPTTTTSATVTATATPTTTTVTPANTVIATSYGSSKLLFTKNKKMKYRYST